MEEAGLASRHNSRRRVRRRWPSRCRRALHRHAALGGTALRCPCLIKSPARLLQLRLMRKVEQAVTLFSLLLQLALYARTATALTARQHAPGGPAGAALRLLGSGHLAAAPRLAHIQVPPLALPRAS